MIGHGFTPGKFTPDSCRVMLARYSCPYSRDEHDPALPPEDVDAFGYRRPSLIPSDIPVKIFHPDVTPECEHIATLTDRAVFAYGHYIGTTDPVTTCVTCHAHVNLEEQQP